MSFVLEKEVNPEAALDWSVGHVADPEQRDELATLHSITPSARKERFGNYQASLKLFQGWTDQAGQ